MTPRETPGKPALVTPLAAGETLLASWQPQMILFVQRAVLLSFVTALVLASLGFLTLVQWLIAVPLLTVIFLLVFDDITTWFRHRGDRWHLTSQRLIFEKVAAPEENAALPLAAIETMRPWFWWSLRLGFTSGTATAMRFVPRPNDIRQRIAQARAEAAAAPGDTPPRQPAQPGAQDRGRGHD